jgi:hypothetical protein
MSLFDDASLVLTPNGYKASKLYSIKPTSGAGDMTVVRGTTARRVNSAGVIESVAINVPRLDYPPLGGCPKILVEPARTNKLFQSQDISSVLWVKSNTPTITTNIALAPDGTTTADGIQSPNAAASFKTISQAIVVTANSTVTASVFVKKETSETNFGGFAYSFTGVTPKVLRIIVNAVAGTAVISSDSTLTATTKVEDYGTYWRISATTTDNGSNTALLFGYYGTLSTNGTSTGTGISSVRTVWGFQLELAANSTSYIPTTTAEITRNADVISKTGISSLIGQTEGTIYFEADVQKRNTGDFYIGISNGASLAEAIYLSQPSPSGSLTILFRTGVLTPTITVLSANWNIGLNKIAIAYNASLGEVFINGFSKGTVALTAIPTCNKFTLGSRPDGGGNLVSGTYNLAALFQTRLTNAQLATLTTL